MPNFSPFADRMMLYCHRTVLKPWFNCSTLTKFHNFSCGVGVRRFSSSPQENLVDKGTSLPVGPPPQSLSSALMFVPPSPRVNIDHNKFDESESEDHHDYFHFFSPAEQTKIRVKKKLSIPWQKELLTPDDAICVGSSHGWLAFVHSRSCCPYLFNPLIESCHLPYVPLPPYETFPHIRCARAQKSDHLSPTSSLVKDFILLDMRTKTSTSEYSDYDNRYADKESKHFIQKVAMSSAPSLPRSSSSPQDQKSSCNEDDDNCTVMVIDREEIYFCKLGEERWHILDESRNAYYDEIMYFSKDQRFYTMAGPKHIEAWDLSDPSSPKREMINPSSSPLDLERTNQILRSNRYGSYLTYLVESSGDLLLVIRFDGADYNGDGTPRGVQEYDPADRYKERVDFVNAEDDDVGPFHQSLRFDVYKLNFDQNKWEFVECLGDRALFVGCNHSFSLSTRDYPELRENSIYFTDDYQPLAISNYTGHDNGIFHLKDDTVTPYYPRLTLKGKLPPVQVPQPVWVAPNKYCAV